MGAYRFLALLIAAGAASAGDLSPALGQCRLCAKPSSALGAPADDHDIQLAVESSINFDRLVMFGQGDGAAIIRPDGSSAAEGTVADIGPRAMVGTATIHGQPGRAIRVELPRRIDLYSVNGGRISFDQIESDLPSLPRLDSTGNLSFRFGGRLRVSGDADGQYRGELPISANYQ